MSRSTLFLFVLFALLSLLTLPSYTSCEESDSTTESGETEGVETYDESEVTDEVEIESGLDDAGSVIGALEPHPDISLTVYFPKYPTKKFMQGETITALVGITNSGPEAFNISYSGAHLHSAIDYTYYVQNFSVYHVDEVVHPGTEKTIEYWFRADTNLEPVDFIFSGWLIYNTSNGNIYKSNFANETVWLIEQPTEFDAKSAFTWLILLGSTAGVGYVVYNSLLGGKKKSKRRERNEINGRPEANWEAAKVYMPSKDSKSVQKKRSKKPSDSNKTDQTKSAQ